jgi:aryl-alcohol dehydrogenase-like predicted oxidoreductase
MDPFTPYTFGSMSLGRNPADIRGDLAVVRRALEAGVWFHSSPTYNMGFTYMVLKTAFDEDRTRVPRMILKVRDGSVPLMRFEVEDSCRRLGLDGIDVAQLVSMDPAPGNLVDQLRGGGGPLVDELASLRKRGLIRQAVVFLTPENSDAAVEASRHELIDGLTLYWNVRQRDCSASAWEAIRQRQIPLLALKTLGGGAAESTPEREAAIAALVAETQCRSRVDLALRHAVSEPVVKTTIGGTASLAHLEEYLEAAKNAAPLPREVLSRVEALQAGIEKTAG